MTFQTPGVFSDSPGKLLKNLIKDYRLFVKYCPKASSIFIGSVRIHSVALSSLGIRKSKIASWFHICHGQKNSRTC